MDEQLEVPTWKRILKHTITVLAAVSILLFFWIVGWELGALLSWLLNVGPLSDIFFQTGCAVIVFFTLATMRSHLMDDATHRENMKEIKNMLVRLKYGDGHDGPSSNETFH